MMTQKTRTKKTKTIVFLLKFALVSNFIGKILPGMIKSNMQTQAQNAAQKPPLMSSEEWYYLFQVPWHRFDEHNHQNIELFRERHRDIVCSGT